MQNQMNKLFKKYFYYVEVLGIRNLIIYLYLRIFRTFLFQKNHLMKIYDDKSYAKKIFIREELNNIPHGNASYGKQIDKYYKRFNLKINKHWHYCYSHVNGIKSEKYIPEIHYYQDIEPFFNRSKMADAYHDKNQYDKFFDDVRMPECTLRCINGIYYDKSYSKLSEEKEILSVLETDREYIIKPSIDGQGGKGVGKLAKKNEGIFLDKEKVDIDSLPGNYRKDFVVQPFITQHPSIKNIYPNSINTIRVISFRLDGEVIVLSSIIRFGNSGSFTDNGSTGGVACGILPDGTLKDFAVDSYFKKYVIHPYTQQPFKGTEIPNMPGVYDLVKKQHTKFHYFDIVSWDIAIGEDKNPTLIEVNLMDQAINFHQLTNGPLFGDNTEDILEKVYLSLNNS